MDKDALLELIATDADVRTALIQAVLDDVRRRVRAGERGMIPPDAIGRRA